MPKGYSTANHDREYSPPSAPLHVPSISCQKVDSDFLAMIKEAEDDESKGAEGAPIDVDTPAAADDKQ